MRNLVGFILLLAIVFTGCSSEQTPTVHGTEPSKQESRVAHLYFLAAKLTDDVTLETDSLVAVELLNKSVAYANEYPADTAAADLLWMGQGAARGLENFTMALVLVDRLISEYPDYEKRAHCLYLKAYLLDFHLNLPEDARKAYQDLIDTYPKYTSVMQARERLQYIGLDDQELMRMLEEKNNVGAD
jgi:tetratricopeptide (TPR) repeat protein